MYQNQAEPCFPFDPTAVMLEAGGSQLNLHVTLLTVLALGSPRNFRPTTKPNGCGLRAGPHWQIYLARPPSLFEERGTPGTFPTCPQGALVGPMGGN